MRHYLRAGNLQKEWERKVKEYEKENGLGSYSLGKILEEYYKNCKKNNMENYQIKKLINNESFEHIPEEYLVKEIIIKLLDSIPSDKLVELFNVKVNSECNVRKEIQQLHEYLDSEAFNSLPEEEQFSTRLKVNKKIEYFTETFRVLQHMEVIEVEASICL